MAEKDLETVRAAALLLESENQRLVQKNIALTRQLLELQGKSPQQLELKLADLEAQLAKRNQMLFGQKSEKRVKAATTTEQDEQRGHGPKAQPELETVEVEIGLPFAIQTESGVQPVEPVMCEHCHQAVTEWVGQFEDSEEIDVVARQFVLKKIKRKKGVLRVSPHHHYSALSAEALRGSALQYRFCDSGGDREILGPPTAGAAGAHHAARRS